MNHSPPLAVATRGGHLLTPAWWGLLALAGGYILWAVLTADRRDPGRMLSPGRVARMRLLRIAVCLPVSAFIAGVFILGYYHVHRVRFVTEAVKAHTTVRAELVCGWAALSLGVAAVLILTASVITRLRTPLPPAPARRAGRRGRRAAAAGPGWPDAGYGPPPGYPPGYQPGYQPLPARRTTRRGSRR